MADEHDRVTGFGEFPALEVNLGDQRAGGVDYVQPALLRLLAHSRGNAMRAENDARALGHFLEFLDENGPGAAQLVDDMAVVNDLLADVNRRAVKIEHNLHDIDSAHHARAKTARTQQDNALLHS